MNNQDIVSIQHQPRNVYFKDGLQQLNNLEED